jgi:ATP-binding cassette subfamily C protein LapB
VSFKIEPGERVGIIGRIGSGKSTLARLLLSMYEPTDGQILVGGIDARQLDPGDLRRNVGYVPQDVILFSGTVRDNITASAIDADDAAILRAADAAGLTDFISGTSAGLDYVIGERGDGLSGGQRQAITVARALIRDPAILLLDEPTSAMDARSEAEVTRSIRGIHSVETILLITHRMSLLTAVDRLIVLDKGKVVADGPRASVLKLLSEGNLRVQSE